MQFYPGILSDSVKEVVARLEVLNDNPNVKTVHLDIMDGYLVDEISVAPLDLMGADFGQLTCDLHLMVDEPMDYLLETQAIKEYLPIRAVIGQVEHMSFQSSFLEEVKVHNWKAGLSLGLHTPVSAIDDDAWGSLDIVQVMGVELGRTGQDFQEVVLSKISELQKEAQTRGRELEIIVDGGVKLTHIPKLKELEVSSVVATSAIWSDPNPDQALSELIIATES